MKAQTRDIHSAWQKTIAIFRELAGERAGHLFAGIPKAQGIIGKALAKRLGRKAASDIAFHMTDWNSNAAFITALLLFPERFSPREIRCGVEQFLIHAPNHIIAAAKLHDWPVADIFGVGALEPESQDHSVDRFRQVKKSPGKQTSKSNERPKANQPNPKKAGSIMGSKP